MASHKVYFRRNFMYAAAHALDLKVEVDTHSPNIEVPNEVVTFDGKWKSTKYLSAHAFDTKFSSTLDFSGELRELSEVWGLLHDEEKLYPDALHVSCDYSYIFFRIFHSDLPLACVRASTD